ncbi:MAG: hypothetical protein ACKPKJ_14220 [Dolichospermum sp.]
MLVGLYLSVLFCVKKVQFGVILQIGWCLLSQLLAVESLAI